MVSSSRFCNRCSCSRSSTTVADSTVSRGSSLAAGGAVATTGAADAVGMTLGAVARGDSFDGAFPELGSFKATAMSTSRATTACSWCRAASGAVFVMVPHRLPDIPVAALRTKMSERPGDLGFTIKEYDPALDPEEQPLQVAAFGRLASRPSQSSRLAISSLPSMATMCAATTATCTTR